MHLPQRTHFAIASSQISVDPQTWDNPEQFQGFRFAEMRATSKTDANKFQFVTTHPSHSMAFGHGKHSCPGRFFSSNMIKIILAHILRKYDIKADLGTSERPENLKFGGNMAPNPDIKILMKLRGDGY